MMAEESCFESYKDIIYKDKDRLSLAKNAEFFVPITEGAILLIPQALVDIGMHSEEVRSIAEAIDTPTTHRLLRSGDRVRYVFEQLTIPNENKCLSDRYPHVTRAALIERAEAEGIDLYKSMLSRILKALIEYGLIRELVPSRGRKPMLLEVRYPFSLIHPDQLHPTEQSNGPVDLSQYRPLATVSEEERMRRLIDTRRQTLHRSRPHETHDMAGNPIKVYSRQAEIRTPSGTATVKMKAQTFEGSDIAVMTKRDDLQYSLLSAWCLAELRERQRLGAPLDDWYLLRPYDLATHLGYANPSNHLAEMSALIERWKDTRVTAEIVAWDDTDEAGEFAQFIASEAISQFSQHKTAYKVTKKGRRVECLAFKLPPDVQKDLERRIRNNEGDERYIEGIANFMLQRTRRSLMTDTFGIAITHFFWTWGRNFRARGGWEFELWEGLGHAFDFEFPVRERKMSAGEWNRIYSAARTQFKRMFQRFLSLFSDDYKRDWEVWTGFTGGEITIDMWDFIVTIKLDARAKNARHKGRIRVVAKPQKIARASDDISTIQRLIENDVRNDIAAKLVKNYGEPHVARCIELLEVVFAVSPNKYKNKPGLLVTFIKEKDPDQVILEIGQYRAIAENKDRKKALSEAMMDIGDLDWGEVDLFTEGEAGASDVIEGTATRL